MRTASTRSWWRSCDGPLTDRVPEQKHGLEGAGLGITNAVLHVVALRAIIDAHLHMAKARTRLQRGGTITQTSAVHAISRCLARGLPCLRCDCRQEMLNLKLERPGGVIDGTWTSTPICG